MFMVMYLAAASMRVLASPCLMRAVAAFRGFQLFCVRAWKVFVVASRLRRKCSSSCRVKPKWGVRWGFAVSM
jgi:hypothetical protein